MNMQLQQATAFAEGQILQAQEAAVNQQDHIEELAKEIVREDLTLSFGNMEIIDIEQAVAKAIEMNAEGQMKFFIEDLANYMRASCESDGFKQAEMQGCHLKNLQDAAVQLITPNYEAIMQSVAEQAA